MAYFMTVKSQNLIEQGIVPKSKALISASLGLCSQPEHLERWLQTLPVMPCMGAS